MASFGGQKGWSGIAEAGGAFFLLGLIVGCQARGWVDGSVTNDVDHGAQEETADFNTDCAAADTDKRRGEEYNEVILADPECVEYLMQREAQEQRDRAQDLKEASKP